MRFITYGWVLLLFSACATNPYNKTNRLYKKQAKELSRTIRLTEAGLYPDSTGLDIPAQWVGTVNFNLRKPHYVIIHHTAQGSVEETLKTFTKTQTQVSAHYLVGQDGKITHLLNDYLRAWHAGIARWGSISDINSVSIGIELDNDGLAPFTKAQISGLLSLLGQLKKNYNIPAANFIAHADIAPSRKVDPQINFPWRKLADRGFGLMPDLISTDSIPPNFDPLLALRIIGYDTREPQAAIRAFKRHFMARETDSNFTPEELQLLYNLYCKY